jgi:Amt family ammonium transporter
LTAFQLLSLVVLLGGLSWKLYFFIERLKIDDPVGAISVHGVNGTWGVLSLGLFADGSYGDGWNGVAGNVTGLFHGDASQLLAQCVGIITCFIFVFTVCYAFFKIQHAIQGLRVPATVERDGLDLPEMGAYAYYDEINSLPQK